MVLRATTNHEAVSQASRVTSPVRGNAMLFSVASAPITESQPESIRRDGRFARGSPLSAQQCGNGDENEIRNPREKVGKESAIPKNVLRKPEPAPLAKKPELHRHKIYEHHRFAMRAMAPTYEPPA